MFPERIRALGIDGSPVASVPEYVEQLHDHGLVALKELAPGAASMVCVVSNFIPAARTSGTDFKMVVRVSDPTMLSNDTVTFVVFRELGAMPDIRGAGDVLYLEDVKVQEFSGKPQLVSKHSTIVEVLHSGDSVDDLLPLFSYLRRGSGPQGVPQSVRSEYLKSVSELGENTRYVDLLVELLHVRPASHFSRPALRCVVTDYTENPLLHDVEVHTGVPGSRCLWCTVIGPGDIPGLPELVVGHFYRLRGAKVVVDRMDGLVVSIERNDKFPKTKVVNEVVRGLPELGALLTRREQCKNRVSRPMLIDTTAPPTLIPAPPTVSAIPAAPIPAAIAPAEPEFVAADVTPISAITGGPDLGTRYHVRVQIVDVFPDSAHDACQLPDLRVVLEVADASGSCLLLCQGRAVEELVGLRSMGMGERLAALMAVWDQAEAAEASWIDLCVAPMVMPGPEVDEGRRPLVRCLALVGGSLNAR
ncbi:hypothetical protein GGH91_001361 [Coemansia sp. RSA 2671]|nr:hypothetical protein LPJ60_002644 [Coemansia sp. RSA 2675]KAJ2348475.1 hypothetical protein GGH91_001361 [Coemansia sp. RSA 2671]